MADTPVIDGTQDPAANGLPFPIPSGTDVYDALIGEIEMDLVSVNLPLLEEKYQDESPEDRSERFKRYEAAFTKFDQAFAEWNRNLQRAVSDLRHVALHTAEERNRTEEAQAITNLEAQLLSA